MRTALIVVLASVASLTWAAGAQGAVVSGSLTDPVGDVDTETAYDMVRFGVSYDDSGAFVITWGTGPRGPANFSMYTMEANVGVWDSAAGRCDVSSTGGVALNISPALDHPLPGDATYTVVNYNGGSPIRTELWHSTWNPTSVEFRDVFAFSQRGYDCVTAVRMLTSTVDTSPITFCMGPSGTVTCPTTPQPIGVRWTSPSDGETVSGFLHEGSTTCWAESTGPVVRTENWVDGRLNDSQVMYPWGCEWDTTQFTNGPHILTVKAFASDGRMVEDSVVVNVSNPSPVAVSTPPPPTTEVRPSGSGVAGSTTAQLPTRVIQTPTPAGASSLTISRAKKLTRRALRRMQGRRYTRRARRGHRITCGRASATRVRCKIAWRYRGSRFAGTALIVQDPKLTRVTLRIRAVPSR